MSDGGSSLGDSLLIAPDPAAAGLTRQLRGIQHDGSEACQAVIEERPLTVFLNSTEIVTAMTIGDYPQYLALGFLFNQGIVRDYADIAAIDHDAESEAVVVRTHEDTRFEMKAQRRIRTSGCAMGTVFGDLFDIVEGLQLPQAELRTSWLYALSAQINRIPSLYLAAGAIHGTVLCQADQPIVYMEDVGRHNAVDKIAGWMLSEGIEAQDKILYTTGRLTSEMVLKTAMMGVPILVSRSGFTAWGVDIARKIGLTLVGRLRGRRFLCLSGAARLTHDADPKMIAEEARRHRRKSAGEA